MFEIRTIFLRFVAWYIRFATPCVWKFFIFAVVYWFTRHASFTVASHSRTAVSFPCVARALCVRCNYLTISTRNFPFLPTKLCADRIKLV